MLLLVLLAGTLGSGCSDRKDGQEDLPDNYSYAGDQPVKNLPFYLNESQQFQVTRSNNGEPEETYQIRRFYLTDYRGIGGTGVVSYYDFTAFSLTYRDHGKNTTEMFVARSDSFPDIRFPEEGVVELRLNPEDGTPYDCNLVFSARIIDFAENGTAWEYRN